MKAVNIYVDKKITQVLKEKLKDENLSAIAREIGVSKSLISDWSLGRLPSLKNIQKLHRLCEYLHLPFEELLLGKLADKKILSSVEFDDDSRSYKILIQRIK